MRAVVRHLAIAALASALLVSPSGAQQDGKVPRIGVLSSTPSAISHGLAAGLKELGRVEGRNIQVEWRWTEGKAERSRELAAELVRLKPDLIVTTSPQPTTAIKAATDTIPIVFIAVGDPVGLGIVASLARPGGNATGFTTVAQQGFAGKMLEMLHSAVPNASTVALLVNPSNATHRQEDPALTADARRLGLNLVRVKAQTASELDTALERAARSRADAILVLGDPLTYVNQARIAELAAKLRLPALYLFRESVEAGGLMSYGPSLHDLGRRAATHVDKILKGARPADLPVEQPTRFDLVVNLRTAKALGLVIPPTVLLRADHLIE